VGVLSVSRDEAHDIYSHRFWDILSLNNAFEASYITKVSFEGGFRIGGRCITNLRYADDIVLIASSEEELQQLVNRVHGAAKDMNMKINVKKTEVMKVSDDPSPITVTVGSDTSRNQVVQVPGSHVQL